MHIVVTHTVRWFGVKIRVCASGQSELQYCRHTNVVTKVMQMAATLQYICKPVVECWSCCAQGCGAQRQMERPWAVTGQPQCGRVCSPSCRAEPGVGVPSSPHGRASSRGGAGFVAGGADGLGSCHCLKTRGHAFLGTFSFPPRCCHPPLSDGFGVSSCRSVLALWQPARQADGI